ncbi:DUF167 domain-containing protein [Rhodospirillum centenum]|uniref:UPF0235 protein RC1_2875 n=1 Tax=Rhodospirillum centenum (strain ATCC 51521 / SW) TaxID=414684 RepID=B6IVB9_RHOCS|nr:DUF167 domain-containing protein [Rhodospirillum centenum]ACJ00243.1 conserved hypothetical protein [Rhodospirillum centenum SW]
MAAPSAGGPRDGAAFAEAAPGGVRVALRVTPKASRTAVQGPMDGPEGRTLLKLAVTAVPEDGKANAAVIALLAKHWRLPKSSMSIVSGGTDRTKVLFIAGDAADLLARIGGQGAGAS